MTHIFTYKNIDLNEHFNKKKLEEKILKLSLVEFYFFILLNENKIKNSTKYYNYILEEYIKKYSIIYDNKISHKQLKQYDITLYDLICNIHENLDKKNIFQKKISNYFNDLDNEKYQPFDKNIILDSYYYNYDILLKNNTLKIENKNNIEKYLPFFEVKLNNYLNTIKNNEHYIHISVLKNNIQNMWFDSVFDMFIINFDNGNYNQMKKYLNILIEKNDLKTMLFMALFHKYFERNNTEEIKYYLKIHKYINEYEIEMLNNSTNIEFN